MEISHARAREMFDQLQRAKAHLRHVRDQAESTIGHAKLLVEVNVGAAAAGYLNVKNGVSGQPWLLFGHEADMMIGFVGGALAIAGVAGKYDEDVLGLSSGILAGWSYRQGAMAAAKATQATGAVSASQYAGAVSASQYAGALPAGQYAGAWMADGRYVQADHATGALPAGVYQAGLTRGGSYVYPSR